MLRIGTMLFTFLFCLISSGFAEVVITTTQTPNSETRQDQAEESLSPAPQVVDYIYGVNKFYTPHEGVMFRGERGSPPPATSSLVPVAQSFGTETEQGE